MKIMLTHNETDILTVKDYDGANPGLIGQMIAEVECIKRDLLDLYEEVEDEA